MYIDIYQIIGIILVYVLQHVYAMVSVEYILIYSRCIKAREGFVYNLIDCLILELINTKVMYLTVNTVLLLVSASLDGGFVILEIISDAMILTEGIKL